MRLPDPYGIFNFIVEINSTQVGGFSEVAGLEAHSEIEEYREGGINHYVHKLVKETKYSNLTLKRGVTDATELWDWYREVIEGRIERKDITIVLQNSKRQEKWRWVFTDAYPVKWSGTDLNASNNTIAVESVEFAHHGMARRG